MEKASHIRQLVINLAVEECSLVSNKCCLESLLNQCANYCRMISFRLAR